MAACAAAGDDSPRAAGCAGKIRDQDVSMQQRISGPGGTVSERGCHESLDRYPFGTPGATTRADPIALKVTNRCRHGGVVCESAPSMPSRPC